MTYYGTYFSEKEITEAVSDLDKVDFLYNGESISEKRILYTKLNKTDTRFTDITIQEIYTLYGISVEYIEDDELMGTFKNKVSSTLSEIFKKNIKCDFYDIKEE